MSAQNDIEVIYKTGKMNVNADALSRNLIPNEKQIYKNSKFYDENAFMTSRSNKEMNHEQLNLKDDSQTGPIKYIKSKFRYMMINIFNE